MRLLLEFRHLDVFTSSTSPSCYVTMTHYHTMTHSGEQTPLREQWYGTEYAVEPLSPDVMAAWLNPSSLNSSLHLPLPNELVPTDFTLKAGPAKVNATLSCLYSIPISARGRMSVCWTRASLWHRHRSALRHDAPMPDRGVKVRRL